MEAGEVGQREVEKQRDGLLIAVGLLPGKMEGMEGGRAASRKRQNDGGHNARPAETVRDE